MAQAVGIDSHENSSEPRQGRKTESSRPGSEWSRRSGVGWRSPSRPSEPVALAFWNGEPRTSGPEVHATGYARALPRPPGLLRSGAPRRGRGADVLESPVRFPDAFLP